MANHELTNQGRLLTDLFVVKFLLAAGLPVCWFGLWMKAGQPKQMEVVILGLVALLASGVLLEVAFHKAISQLVKILFAAGSSVTLEEALDTLRVHLRWGRGPVPRYCNPMCEFIIAKLRDLPDVSLVPVAPVEKAYLALLDDYPKLGAPQLDLVDELVKILILLPMPERLRVGKKARRSLVLCRQEHYRRRLLGDLEGTYAKS